jgi:hypothetical protein
VPGFLTTYVAELVGLAWIGALVGQVLLYLD